MDSGAEALDYSQIAKDEKLSYAEIELRRLENVLDTVVDELEYLKEREMKMRDTNGGFHFLSLSSCDVCGFRY